jgi:hypothetical protein
MTYVLSLPETYTPFHILELCSNKFVDVKVPMAVRDFPVLLVGRGVVPIVWLGAPRQIGASDWIFVVAEGQSNNPLVQVDIDKAKGRVVIKAGGTVLLQARTAAQDHAIVEKLDLRPVGLAVTGDTSTLHVGTNQLSGNTIQAANTGIALG